MDREVKDKTILDEFVMDFVGIVEKHVKYVVVSGFVAIAHGRTRGTEDIDIIIERVPKEVFTRLHQELVESGFGCLQSSDANELYDEYLLKKTSLRYVRKNSHVPEMELKMSKDSLDDYQLQTKKKFPLTGLDIYFSSIEMNIAFKEELLKSEKDMEDARHLRIVYEEKIDKAEIEKIKDIIRRLRLNAR